MKRILILITAILMLTSISCSARGGLDIGDKAPDFTLPDLANRNIKLSDVISANKATLLVFWTTWCPYCRKEIPELTRLNAQYGDKGLKIVSVDIGESKKKVESVARQEGIQYTVLLDADNRVASQYGIQGIPANILITSDGTIKYRGTQPPPEDMLFEK